MEDNANDSHAHSSMQSSSRVLVPRHSSAVEHVPMNLLLLLLLLLRHVKPLVHHGDNPLYHHDGHAVAAHGTFSSELLLCHRPRFAFHHFLWSSMPGVG